VFDIGPVNFVAEGLAEVHGQMRGMPWPIFHRGVYTLRRIQGSWQFEAEPSE
jgi:hypothetical protein